MKCHICGRLSKAEFDLISTPSMLFDIEHLTCATCYNNRAESTADLTKFLQDSNISDLCAEVRLGVTVYWEGRYVGLIEAAKKLGDALSAAPKIQVEIDKEALEDEAIARLLMAQSRTVRQIDEARPMPVRISRPRGAIAAFIAKII